MLTATILIHINNTGIAMSKPGQESLKSRENHDYDCCRRKLTLRPIWREGNAL
jgi:hypothetical protein